MTNIFGRDIAVGILRPLFNSLYLAPVAEDEMVAVIENAESDAGTATLIEGRFHKTTDNGGVVYVEQYKEGQRLEKVFAAHWPKQEDSI